MPRKRAFLVGLTHVDKNAYGGWDGRDGCKGCAKDVDRVARILAARGFAPSSIRRFMDGRATARAVLSALEAEAKRARPGDLLVFYYSGHGGQVDDASGDEDDGSDETLVLYDRQLIDDELNERVWTRLAPGVRVVMISDSCHSETNMRMRAMRSGLEVPASVRIAPLDRIMSPRDSQEMRAEMIHLSGCRDAGTSMGYADGGAFTKEMDAVLKDDAFDGNYYALLTRIAASPDVSRFQEPRYNEYGDVSEEFREQRPFSDAADRDDDRPAPPRPDPISVEAGCLAGLVTININIGDRAIGRDGHSRDGHSRDGHSRDGHSRDGHSRAGRARDGHSR